MKVILTEDVQHLGESGAIKEVANGYARNYLLPRGLAKPATPGMVKVIEERKAAEVRRVAKAEEESRSLATLIGEQTIHLKVRVGKQGRLYGSITAADIANVLSQQIGQTIDRRKVELAENIHSTGTYEVLVKLVGKLSPKIKVVVESDVEPEETSAPTEE
ncbi:MAG: 50S ribosomal protein L9 [Chloroflexota bacterium]|nr:50S ribosomal protein L9 [Chloroflexota bacterium]